MKIYKTINTKSLRRYSTGHMEVPVKMEALPRTTKRRITTNLKSINNQKCQKIKLHGTPTTKELKKKINQKNQTGQGADHSGWLRKTAVKWQTLGPGMTADLGGLPGRGWLKGTQKWLWATAGVAPVGEPPSLTWESESPLKSDPETSSWAAPFPLWCLPYRQCRSTAKRVALPGWIPKAPSPYNLSAAPRQRKRAKQGGDCHPIWWRI